MTKKKKEFLGLGIRNTNYVISGLKHKVYNGIYIKLSHFSMKRLFGGAFFMPFGRR